MVFGAVDEPLACCVMVHVWVYISKQQLVCKFDIAGGICYWFFAFIHVLINYRSLSNCISSQMMFSLFIFVIWNSFFYCSTDVFHRCSMYSSFKHNTCIERMVYVLLVAIECVAKAHICIPRLKFRFFACTTIPSATVKQQNMSKLDSTRRKASKICLRPPLHIYSHTFSR